MQTYRKTEAGKSEIATRSGQVSPRLRSLLVMIDGKRDTDELMRLWSVLGYGPESFAELMQLGMIEAANDERQTFATEVNGYDSSPAEVVSEEPVQADASDKSPEMAKQLIYAFYCDTVRELIGLRGFFFQLKVEKAETMDDYRALRADYIQLVTKSRGEKAALAISTQLDQLLAG